MSIPPDCEPTKMENELYERLKTTQNRVEMALLLIKGQESVSPRYNELLHTVLEDMFYGCQIILDRFCVKED